jgi:membrane glycosyltransferase
VMDAARASKWHLAVGAAMALFAIFGSQSAIWMSPIFAGLLVSPLLIAWTSRASLGESSKAHGFFLIPEERRPSPLMRSAQPSAEDRGEPSPQADGGHWAMSPA